MVNLSVCGEIAKVKTVIHLELRSQGTLLDYNFVIQAKISYLNLHVFPAIGSKRQKFRNRTQPVGFPKRTNVYCLETRAYIATA